MKLHWKALFRRDCEHAWQNTGDQYTDPRRGITLVMKECTVCGTVVIAGI